MAIFLFSRWRPVAILDFDTCQKWRYGTLRTAHVYHLAKFGDNILQPISDFLLMVNSNRGRMT